MTGLVDNESLLGEGKDFAEQLKRAQKKLDTCMAALKGSSLKLSRRRAPAGTFQSVVDIITPQQRKAALSHTKR